MRLRTDMKIKNATARIQDLLTNYHTSLVLNGLKWIINETARVAVGHVLSTIHPQTLPDRLTSYLSLAKYELRKYFQIFLKHAIHLAEDFQIVHSGSAPHPGRSDTAEGVE